VVGTYVAVEVVAAFLNATFSHEERHRRRVAKVNDLDRR
jgi:ribose 5-phosphate isomerase RpiB